MQWYLTVVWIFNSLITIWCLLSLQDICISSLMWCLFRPSAPYSIRLFVHFLIFEFKELFVYFGQQSFVRCEFCKYFLPGLSSHSLDSIFHWQKFLILKKSSLSIISFVDHAFDTVSKKSSPNPSRFSPLFPSRSFIVLH